MIENLLNYRCFEDSAPLYDFGARNYDAALGRWMNVDPLGEIYMKTSPYAFTANNPIYNREIDGRYFEGKDEKRAERMEKKAEKKADKLEKKADKMENKGKDSGDLRDRAEELRQSAQDVRDMRSDENTQYRYSSTNSKEAKSLGLNGKPATVGTGTNDKGHNVVTMFTSSKMENKLHETRHGGQHMRGEINAITQKSSVNAEVSAYRAGYSWKGTMQYMTHNFDQTNILSRVILNTQGVVPGTIITINSINQINANMVLDIGEFHTHETMGTWVLPLYQKD